MGYITLKGRWPLHAVVEAYCDQRDQDAIEPTNLSRCLGHIASSSFLPRKCLTLPVIP